MVPDLTNPYYAPVIRGVADGLEANELVGVVTETRDDPARAMRLLEHLAERRVDGLITLAARDGDALRLEEFSERVAPVVLGVRSLTVCRLPAVHTDERRGGALAARHLVALGHRRLGQLRGPPETNAFPSRAIGFAEEARALECEVLEPATPGKAPTYDEGLRLTRELLQNTNPVPTALFAGNDLMAVGAIDAVRDAGLRCPEDISVIGYNDSPFVDHLSPPLSTIRVASYEIGYRAAAVLLALLRGEVVPRSSIFEPLLVERGSTQRHDGLGSTTG